MKTFIKYFLFALFLLSVAWTKSFGQLTYIGLKDEANVQNAQKQIGGIIYGGYWPKTQIINDYLYIPTINGIYRKDLTTLDNTDWELYAFEGMPIREFIKKNDTILAATAVYSDEKLLLISTDSGKSYQDYTHLHFLENDWSKTTFSRLIQNPYSPNTILAMHAGAGVSRSYDFGKNWKFLTGSIGGMNNPLLDYNPHDTLNIFSVSEYSFFDSYLWTTYDNGNYWEIVDFVVALIYGIAFHPTDKNTMIYYGDVLTSKSTDQGLSWTWIRSLEETLSKVIYNPKNSDVLYGVNHYSTNDTIKIYYSVDGGDNWDLFYKEAILNSEGVLDIHLYENKLIIYTFVNGVYYLDLDNMPEIKYEYVPTVKENTQWSYCNLIEEGAAGEKTPYYSYIYFEGDTVINESAYKKLYHYYCANESLYYVAAMREEKRKVYAVRKNIDEQEVLLYDYSLEVGESYHLDDFTLEVTKIDTIEVADKLRKRFFFDSYSAPIIEGIGALHTYFFYDIFGPIVPENDLYLNFYKENGTITYRTYEWFFSEKECPTPVVNLKNSTHPDQILLMNPIKDQLMFNVDLLDKTYQLEVIDLYGRVVLQNMVSKERNSVSVANMNNGLYLYRLINNGGIFYQGKVVKSN